jgi:hypothetical protein
VIAKEDEILGKKAFKNMTEIPVCTASWNTVAITRRNGGGASLGYA